MDLAVKEQIAQHTKVLDKSEAWSMLNLTANNNLEDIIPVGDRIVVQGLACTEYKGNLPESYTVIRGQQYVTEVIAVGEDVKLVEKETAVVSMYSGHHVTTKNRARKNL
jgi:co-chaperonin GroES (HSP10)